MDHQSHEFDLPMASSKNWPVFLQKTDIPDLCQGLGRRIHPLTFPARHPRLFPETFSTHFFKHEFETCWIDAQFEVSKIGTPFHLSFHQINVQNQSFIAVILSSAAWKSFFSSWGWLGVGRCQNEIGWSSESGSSWLILPRQFSQPKISARFVSNENGKRVTDPNFLMQ